MYEGYKQHPTYKNVWANESGELRINGKDIKGTKSTSGYRQYCIEGKSKLGHRLVCESFLGRELSSSEVVNHKNQNRLDNNLSNLEVGTGRDNIQHHFRVNYKGIVENDLGYNLTTSCGERNSQAKLTKEQARELINLTREGWCNDSLGEKFGIHSRYVSLIRHRKRWKSLWKEMGLQSATTIPSGSSLNSLGKMESSGAIQMSDFINI